MIKNKEVAFGLIVFLVLLVGGLTYFLLHNEKERIVTLPECDDSVTTLADGVDTETVLISFDQCKPCQDTLPVAFGSTIYRKLSNTGDSCLFEYGGDSENQQWDGNYTYRCEVPFSQGAVTFAIGLYGIDFSPLSAFCNKI